MTSRATKSYSAAGFGNSSTAIRRSTAGRTAQNTKNPLPPSEHEEQSAVLEWWRLFSRALGIDERLLFSIPNGAMIAGDARLRAIRVHRLKAEGLRVGIPDLLLAIPRFNLGAAGLFIEMKAVDGKASKEQMAMADLLRQMGYHVVIAYGFDEAKRAIEGYLKHASIPKYIPNI